MLIILVRLFFKKIESREEYREERKTKKSLDGPFISQEGRW
jgi:hypothetical protein